MPRGSFSLWCRLLDGLNSAEVARRGLDRGGLYLFSHVTMIGAWCKVRGNYRAFRAERVKGCRPLDERFNGRNGAMMAEFVARFQSQQASLQQPFP